MNEFKRQSIIQDKLEALGVQLSKRSKSGVTIAYADLYQANREWKADLDEEAEAMADEGFDIDLQKQYLDLQADAGV
jgi:hypothetical protein